MARLARVVAPGYPHHLTQRGNRRQQVFFGDDDYAAYRSLMAEWLGRSGCVVWAYCLMPNHVHLVVVPGSAEGLRAGVGEAHRRYTRRVNFRENWRGHLWQGRFSSYVMDERHLLAAVRYIELNPVRAGLVARPEDWRWSSVHGHLAGEDDELLSAGPMLDLVGKFTTDWRGYLGQDTPGETLARLRQHERTGRPAGSPEFVGRLERLLGRPLRRRKPGPKPKAKE